MLLVYKTPQYMYRLSSTHNEIITPLNAYRVAKFWLADFNTSFLPDA